MGLNPLATARHWVRKDGAAVVSGLAAIPSRKRRGYESWAWPGLGELAVTAPRGATRAHLDSVKLLAVLIQHSDSKPGRLTGLTYEPGTATT